MVQENKNVQTYHHLFSNIELFIQIETLRKNDRK